MRYFFGFYLLLVGVWMGVDFSHAHDIQTESLHLIHPVAPSTLAGQKNGVVYMVIENTSTTPIAITTAASVVAERVELHTHEMQDGIVQMRQIEKIDLPPEELTVLEQGGIHIMLIALKEPLEVGKTYPLTLTFENHPPLEITFEVEDAKSFFKSDKHNGQSGHSH